MLVHTKNNIATTVQLTPLVIIYIKLYKLILYYHNFSYVINILLLSTYCLCLLLSIPLVFSLIYIWSMVNYLYEEMLLEDKQQRTAIYTLGSNLQSMRMLIRRTSRYFSRESRTSQL